MEKKQTAIEWLIDKVEDHFCLLPVDLIQQAMKMQEEQFKDFFMVGGDWDELPNSRFNRYFDSNYNKFDYINLSNENSCNRYSTLESLKAKQQDNEKKTNGN